MSKLKRKLLEEDYRRQRRKLAAARFALKLALKFAEATPEASALHTICTRVLQETRPEA